MVRPTSNDLRAIVRPKTALEHFELDRWAPEPPLDRFVDRFWRTAWDLPEPFEQTIVTHPSVNLVFQADGTATLSGPQRENDRRVLDGRGWALGVMFRPGGFRPFVDVPLADLTDQRLPIDDVFGRSGADLRSAVASVGRDEERLVLIDRFLADRAPTAPTIGEELSSLVESAAAADPPVTRASELAARHGVSLRTLQRQFTEHVGLGPKAVLDRCRVHNAAEQARQGARSWSEVAQALGYADQAHLTVSFAELYGAPPASYARREAGAHRPTP